MATSKWTELHFRKRLKLERERRGWTQKQFADALSDKDIHLAWTTIAKIEKGSRSVRIDEAAAIADLFGISVDSLLGRRARPKSDRVHILTAAGDTAIRSAGQIIDIAEAVRDRVADLSPPDDDLPSRESLIVGFERIYELLVEVNDALTDTAQAARRAIRDEVRAK
ncbi:hypothetical protein B4U45_18325 [Mycobacterium persicum]|uniref:HTH cro/C1-type domain-containing protein n=1 Tax=Mycobacterium persicum TaxID=1487726 RepID=A0A8E2IW41_9MYCO|nr:helix-turn-helix transcriptional regulator [Mycobacterium persicum]KZS79937.1 hypothetical protein A4G31_17200 [Mycobacterium persicum]ORB40469.1 hypothetical protein BST40_21910 [Mycobacterium persicum]ORB96245.1 hypothetical protein B1T44_19025 [Mycobacterium persicum]ORC02956.1 hypothetical protein B1T48_18555 [Mycobacterium persicum]ORC08266.1 hypothetical protein B4U45_18325 [Mycobacterium persicum]